MISRAEPLLSLVNNLVPILNGRDSEDRRAYLGPQRLKTHRYLLILYTAKSAYLFKLFGKEFDNSLYFTLYRLSEVAKSFSKPIHFDRSKVALRVYENSQKAGYTCIKKLDGETYITITEKGDEYCLNLLEDLIALAKIHGIAPKVLEDKYLSNDKFIRKGIRPSHLRNSVDLELVVENIVHKVSELNNIIDVVEDD